jgi:hypothetical protein
MKASDSHNTLACRNGVGCSGLHITTAQIRAFMHATPICSLLLPTCDIRRKRKCICTQSTAPPHSILWLRKPGHTGSQLQLYALYGALPTPAATLQVKSITTATAPVACFPAAIAADAQCIVHVAAGQALHRHVPHLPCRHSSSSSSSHATSSMLAGMPTAQ